MSDRKMEIIIKAQDFATKELNKIKKSISKVSIETKKATKNFKGMGDKMKKGMIGLATSFTAVSAAAGTFGAMFFNVADDVETTIGKAKTVFGDYFKDIDKFGKETAKSMGLTRSEFLKTAAGIQDLLIPMGFTREEATQQTQELISLSGALAEWSAGQYQASEVGDILAKAMLGEREQLKSLGISISEHDVKQQLLKDGTSELTGTQLQQARATATQKLIFEKSTDAQKAYADGADSLTRKKAEMTATLGNLKETIATSLIPAFHSIVKTIQPVIEKVAESIQKWFENKENVEKLTMVFQGIIATFKVIFQVIGTAISWLYKLGEALGFAMFKAWEMWQGIKEAFSNMKEKISNSIIKIKTIIVKTFNNLVSLAKNWGSNMVKMFVDGIKNKIKAVKNAVGSIATTISDYLGFHSPTKKGPASDSDKWMPNFIFMLVKGIDRNKGKFSKSAQQLSTILYEKLGQGVGMESIQKTLDGLQGKFQTAFGSLEGKISTSTQRLSGLKNELKSLEAQLDSERKSRKESNLEGREQLAKRVLQLEEELGNKELTRQEERILKEELALATEKAGLNAIDKARDWASLNETERIIANNTKRREAFNEQISGLRLEVEAKKEAIEQEEGLLQKLQDTKITFENQYHSLFMKNITERQVSIQKSIKAMNTLNKLKGLTTQTTTGARANGGSVQGNKSYLVGERGPEIFTPSGSGSITTNNNVGGAVNINMGGVTVSNEADENRLIEKMEKILIMKAKYFNHGIS